MDKKTTLTWLLRDEVSATAKKINGALDTMGLKAKTAGKGVAGTASSLTDLQGAALPVLGTIGAIAAVGWHAADAFIKEEVGVGRLSASLKANVPAWDGNTGAVEDSIKAMEDWSAFSDDDLRKSLAGLVGATHDVNKAFDVLRVAMDLARYKGISLQDASDALTRVEAGQYRILKSLGIQLPQNATQVQALAAVEKIASGQAKEYGDSHQGAMDKIGNFVNDFTEGVGGVIVGTADVIGGAEKNVNDFSASAASSIRHVFNGTEKEIGDLQVRLTGWAAKSRAEIGGVTKAVLTLNDGFRQAIQMSTDDALTEWLYSRNQLPNQKKNEKKPTSGSGKKEFASGGELPSWGSVTVGEQGPERLTLYPGGGGHVTPNMGGGGFTIRGVSEAEIVAMVDRGLYFKLSRSSPSAVRK